MQEARLGLVPSASRSQCTSTCCSPSHVQICEHMQVPAGTQIKAPLSTLPARETAKPEHGPRMRWWEQAPSAPSIAAEQHLHSFPMARSARAPGITRVAGQQKHGQMSLAAMLVSRGLWRPKLGWPLPRIACTVPQWAG